jgi:hypothetical protein
MFRKTTLWLVVLLAAISFSMACGGQEDEANKLVNEANGFIDKAKATDAKIGSLSKELLGEAWMNAEDNVKYVADNKAKFDELVGLDEQNEKAMTEAAGKFDQAAKLKVDDKFKEYLGLKSQEFKKLSEKYKAESAFLKSLLAEKDSDKAGKLSEDYAKKSADIMKEAAEITAKVEKVMKDNPDIFKK